MKSTIQTNNSEEITIKHFGISKSRQVNFRDLLNEWNHTPPMKQNQSTSRKPEVDEKATKH
ncbi:hypothetical protein [Mucilaginibacter rubeus]|uniref:Uncharacterized protein n=1 Tax=Mucilaginibacter rubeus TaxID=2027860 RepID=A0A5C1I4Z7_9SPHI|nr:hypothetical protein [Mucilaginibacter rubeus]QEM12975.1 hypothetical protein DEO27_024165 [Mucilaginibacter rubeus]